MEKELLEINSNYIDVRKTYEGRKEFDNVQGIEPVIKDGNIDSDLMIIARDLGINEVNEKIPLIGRAGSIIRYVLKELELEDTTYITNIVPYKPTDNLAFNRPIILKFLPVLIKQIKMVKPKVIIMLGKNSAQTVIGETIFGLKKYISSWIGHRKMYEKKYFDDFGVYLMPSVHPSYLIRNGVSPENLKEKYEENKNVKFLYDPFLIANKIIKTIKGDKKI